MTKEEQQKIKRHLWTLLVLGLAAVIMGVCIQLLGLQRKLVLLELCAFVFGFLAMGMALVKMVKFRKFLKGLDR
jgi:ABC-type uncharacterized transport system permease subunit